MIHQVVDLFFLGRLSSAAVAAGVGVLLGAGVVAVFWAVTLSNLVAAVGLWLYYRHEVGDGMLRRASERASA